MELRVLRYFLAVAQEGSVTRAARLLHVTQPTLSRQLQDLEQELGQQLFVRSTKRLTLTREGLFLQQRATDIVDLANRTTADFHKMGSVLGGEIAIGCAETEGMRDVIRVLKEIQSDSPAVTVRLISGNSYRIKEELANGSIDFGVLIQPVDLTGYETLRLPHKEVWGLLMRKDAPLAKKKEITRKDLESIPILCPAMMARISSGEGSPEIRAWFGNLLPKLHAVGTFNLIFNAAIMVEEGIGYALTLDHLVEAGRFSSLCFRRFRPTLKSDLDLVWLQHKHLAPAPALFLRRLRALTQPREGSHTEGAVAPILKPPLRSDQGVK